MFVFGHDDSLHPLKFTRSAALITFGTVLIPTNRKIVFPMKKYQLGEFEEIVMLTIGILYKEAYGVANQK